MKTLSCISLLLLSATMSCASDDHAPSAKAAPPKTATNWAFEETPAWSDEFDYTGKPNSTKWGYDIGGNGWGNHELEYYTNDIKNASVANGVLTITAIKENIHGNTYSSARLVTKNKEDFLYGRVEVKAKLPAGKGTWPAIWMLPTDWKYGGWPKSGEIDIMEMVGYDLNNVHITVHTEAYNHVLGTQVGKAKIVPNTTTEFHKYRIDWTPDAILGFIDDEKIFEFDNEGNGSATWPFDQKFHLLMNIAVGGDWGGAQGVDESAFPASMQVDYVRVYALKQK